MPMPSKDVQSAEEKAKQGFSQYASAWGQNPLPATLTATLITAQHLRPLQPLPLLFSPILLFSSYLNVNGYKKDSGGITSAWSAAYLVIARRRHQSIRNKFGARGLVRGATLGLCAVNFAAGIWTYVFSEREEGK